MVTGYRWSASALALVLLMGTGALTHGADDTANTIVYRATISHEEWPGWKFNPDPHRPALKPEQFEIVNWDGRGARTYSGKIVGLHSMEGVEVGIVSLVGIPWTHEDAYQWEKVAPDGTFFITDARYLDADKAIAMRGPQTAWTFLRFNFNPQHGAKNIVLNAAPSRKVTVTLSGPDMKNLSDFWLDQFDAYSQTDDHGNELNREWNGTSESENATSVEVVVPLGEVALFVHHDGYAGFYQVVDARKADHFHFVLMRGGELKVQTLGLDGKPKSHVGLNWKNPAAPLSYWEVHTNEKGEFVGRNLVPGSFEINSPGFAAYSAEVQPNAMTTVVFQDGKKPLVSRTSSDPPR